MTTNKAFAAIRAWVRGLNPDDAAYQREVSRADYIETLERIAVRQVKETGSLDLESLLKLLDKA